MNLILKKKYQAENRDEEPSVELDEFEKEQMSKGNITITDDRDAGTTMEGWVDYLQTYIVGDYLTKEHETCIEVGDPIYKSFVTRSVGLNYE
jgi:hypothetical protein